MYHLRYIGGSNLNLSDGLKHGCILHQNIIQNNTKDRMHNFVYIYIFIAIALDESIFLDVLHFPMKNIKSRDLEATPMGGATSKPVQ